MSSRLPGETRNQHAGRDLKKFFDWNNKVFNDPMPRVAWDIHGRSNGDAEYKVFIQGLGGFYYYKRTPLQTDSKNTVVDAHVLTHEENKQIENNKRLLLDGRKY